MRDRDVLAVLDRLATAEIAVWLDGGWGVDALVGRQTRVHDDLDLVIALDQSERARSILVPLGYRLSVDERPVRFVLQDATDRKIDFHTVRFNAVGDGCQCQPNGGDFIYPASGFSGQGNVDGHAVSCLTPNVQLLCHTGYQLDASDRHDMRLLRDHFGLPLPTDAVSELT